MTRNRRMLSILFSIAVIPILVESNVKTCGNFGHACFGGYGKRAQFSTDARDQLNQITSLEPMDYKTLQIFRQFCSLPPENYLKMLPVFRRLMEKYIAADELTKRK